MLYTIDEQGIHFVMDDPQPIPDAEAVEIVKRLADKQRADLEAVCECAQQGAQPCGTCGTPPTRRV